jgi:hypothetical protein
MAPWSTGSGRHPLKVEKRVRFPPGLLGMNDLPRRDRGPPGSHKAGSSGSIPGPGTCGRAGARPSFIRSDAAVRLPGPLLVSEMRSMARYANWHSDQFERLMSVGSTPTRATGRMGCWSNGTTPGLQPGNRGSTPRRSTRIVTSRGPTANDASLTKRKRGFDSLRDDFMTTIRKGKPKGDGTRFEIGRAMSLEGSTPSPSAGRAKHP